MNLDSNLLKTNKLNRTDNCVIYSLQFCGLNEYYLLIVQTPEERNIICFVPQIFPMPREVEKYIISVSILKSAGAFSLTK